MKNMPDAYGRDLDLNLLRVFAVVAEEGSVTRAASRLYVTQPAVSAAMRRLADFLGAEVFARQGRGVVLTARGTDLLIAARAHLGPLVSAAMAAPAFDPAASTAQIRLGLADALESIVLPPLLALLRGEAPGIQLVVSPVQFRTVEDALLSGKVDIALGVADELPRSILRQSIALRPAAGGGFVCLHDPRFSRVPRKLTTKAYFAAGHVIVSYAGDVRGVVEDALGMARKVRISVPSFGYVADVVDGSPLLATMPRIFADHVRRTRPHLEILPLPFSFDGGTLDMLWPRVKDDDAASRFVRSLLVRAAGEISRLSARPAARLGSDEPRSRPRSAAPAPPRAAGRLR